MKKYIGTKTVYAQPMTAEEAKEKGYKVGGNTGNGYEVEYKDGYKSWCPCKAFEDAYLIAETPLDRMEIEYMELAKRFDKLNNFLAKDIKAVIEKVGDNQVALMLWQRACMSNYLDALEQRVQDMREKLISEAIKRKEDKK